MMTEFVHDSWRNKSKNADFYIKKNCLCFLKYLSKYHPKCIPESLWSSMKAKAVYALQPCREGLADFDTAGILSDR